MQFHTPLPERTRVSYRIVSLSHTTTTPRWLGSWSSLPRQKSDPPLEGWTNGFTSAWLNPDGPRFRTIKVQE